MFDYIIKKGLQIHQCDICLKFAKESESLDNSKLFTHLKAFDHESGKICSFYLQAGKIIYIKF